MAQMGPRPVAIVTGATGGIGLALARKLDDRGYSVLVHGYRDDERGRKISAELTDSVYVDADVSDHAQAAAIAALAQDRWGRIDVLVNNAGIGEPIPHASLDSVTPELWQRYLGVNLLGPWFLVLAARGCLRERRGSVLNMASIAGLTVSGSSIPYAVSKAGLIHLTRMLAVVLGPDIRVNAVAPGYIETARTSSWTEVRHEVTTRSPLRRLGVPDDVAAACLSLLDSPYTTGTVLTVDGGLSLV
jgi:ketoreductase RED2